MCATTTQSHRDGRRWPILPLALGGLLVGCAPRSGVQAPVPVRGDPVRVTTGDHKEVYEFRELRGDVLVVESGSGDPLWSIPLEDINGLEAVVGHRSQALEGAAIGLALGAAFGFVVGWGGACAIELPFEDCSSSDQARAAREAATVGGVVGAAVGALIGSRSTAVWAPVESTALQIQAQASAGGLGLQLSWRP